MNEAIQLIIGITIFILLIWVCSGGMNNEPNLTDGSNCYTSGNQIICN
jgi:hypothetical protein